MNVIDFISQFDDFTHIILFDCDYTTVLCGGFRKDLLSRRVLLINRYDVVGVTVLDNIVKIKVYKEI